MVQSTVHPKHKLTAFSCIKVLRRSAPSRWGRFSGSSHWRLLEVHRGTDPHTRNGSEILSANAREGVRHDVIWETKPWNPFLTHLLGLTCHWAADRK